MDLQSVKELAHLMEEKGLTSLEVEEDGHRICLKKEQSASIQTMPVLSPVPDAQTPVSASPENNGIVDFNDITEVKSPMVGTVYVAPSPGADPFVQVGDKVKKGQVLCVIEAMKLMNEITAEQDGTITEVCAKNGQVVEYGAVLFRIGR